MTVSEERERRVVASDDRYEHHARWTPGERLHDLFAELVAHHPDRAAMDTATGVHSFAELDRHADHVAALLRDHGVRTGDRVALVLDQPFDAYAAMLAVGRVGAAFVPLDVAFPAERIGYICTDADVRVLVTSNRLHAHLPAADRRHAVVDVETTPRGGAAPARPEADATDGDATGDVATGGDAAAYVIYTSGTTGRPKGVVVNHSSICNFVRVAAEVYGFRADDRVYQGMTIAFDFSVEESWVPWMAGATLVPRPAGGALVGGDLESFVLERGITALCCVPTLLSTLDAEALASVRFVLVSGEACPSELAVRWSRPGRRFLNVYGPTEATVTATWSEIEPGRPVTLGRPLPTYTAVILDPDRPELVPDGEVGEIGLAGIGLACGYLGRDDLTATAFVEDFLDLPHNPSARIYRTGDLGRLTDDSELAYLGRIDTQVKVRGYRIELTEIESVLLGVPGVGQAVVATFEPVAGMTELVGYYTTAQDDFSEDGLHAALAERLPSYMVPAYFHRLETIPFTTSDKVDRRALPVPAGRRRTSTAVAHVAPASETERVLAGFAEQVLGLEQVSVTADLFTDLAGNSLLMATLCALARAAGFPLSIKDCYRTPTVRALAAGLDATTRPDPVDAPAAGPSAGPSARPLATVDPRSPRRRSVAFAATGVAQLAVVFGYLWGLSALGEVAYDAVNGIWSAFVVTSTVLVALCVVPVALKWLLVGRWREGSFALWGPRYLRFWVVRTAVRANPLVLFAGTPLYNCYLRALGARIGPRAVVLTRHVPVCTDLVTVGADAVVRADVWMQGYRVDGTVVTTGRVDLGPRAYAGESSVLDVATSIGADAQLAHASSLQSGQHLPDRERWHGSPAEPAPAGGDFQRIATDPAATTSNPVLRASTQVLAFLTVLAVASGVALADLLLLDSGTDGAVSLLVWSAVAAAATFFGELVVAAALALVGGRWLGRALRAGTSYPMHGPHHAVLRLVEMLSNRAQLVTVLGDSALITGWMRALGWDLGQIEQTGSNFGTTHRHQVPLLTRVGRGTMISDGLSMANADISSTHFRVRDTALGQRSFVGNRVVVPAGARLGDNVLLATKVLVPVDGPVHHDVGLLGSPAFEIPRSVERDTDRVPADRLPGLLLRKRRHNLVTIALLLLSRWVQMFLTFALAVASVVVWHVEAGWIGAACLTASIFVSAGWFVAVETLATRRRLVARQCSIYDPAFWVHERTWKLLTPYLSMFDGTPFKPLLLRMLGVRVGRRLFDDGAAMPEHPLVTIGSDCTLNAGSILQCHSLEDGQFKSGPIVLGDDVTVGTGAFVHYEARLEHHTTLAADSFLMKGSVVTAHSSWAGNPAVFLSTNPTSAASRPSERS